MFRNLTLRTKLVAIVVPPLVVLAVVAAYGVLLGFRGADSLDQLTGDVRVLGVTALASFLLSALAVIVIGRTITDPLDELSSAADELANVRLPLLVESLRTPGMETPEFAPIAIEQQNDEMGKLVAALNAVQDSAAQVATEQQTLVRQGLSELVVNLARRNQSLLDRQIEFIDKLESNEQDPDRLEELFGLDHLATRMRRNAESLLVLAGAEPSRRRGGPVAVADILRVAMSEIEDYRHVHLMQIDEAEIGASAAVDLAHLLSEVMENATQFSPPESPVEVNGMAQSDGCYLITVADHGLGMTDEQITASNHILTNPPELGLSLSRSLGFIVIGRLAKRLEVEVELAYTDGGGITALVLVPMSILTGTNAPHVEALPADVGRAPEAQPELDPTMPPPAALPAAASSMAAPTDEPSWRPPVMPDRGVPFGQQAPEAPAAAAVVPRSADAPQSDALAKLLGVGPTDDEPAPVPFDPATAFGPAPADPIASGFEELAPPQLDLPAFDAPPFDAAPPPPAPQLDPPQLDAPQFDAPQLDAPQLDAPQLDAPQLDAPQFDTAPVETPQFDAAPPDASPFESDVAAFDSPPPPASLDSAFEAAPTFEATPEPFEASPPVEVAPSFDAAPPVEAAPTFEAGQDDPFAPPPGAPNPFGGAALESTDFESTSFGSTDFGQTDGSDNSFGSDFDSGTLDPALTEPAAPQPFDDPTPQPAEADVWQGPNFGAPETIPGPSDLAPTNLEQAIPSGEQFDTGMASLLDESAPATAGDTTTSGLVKRDRSKSQAPTNEGRPIKASARSPEEVRQMLARYRDGRNRSTTEATDPNSEYQSGEQS